MNKFFRNITLGGIVGVVIGLLFAPQKGEKTRQQLHDSLEKGKEKFKEIKDEIEHKKEQEPED